MAGLQQRKKIKPQSSNGAATPSQKKKKRQEDKNAVIPKTLPTSASAENDSYLRGFENVCCVF
jgi:hypothetical protein